MKLAICATGELFGGVERHVLGMCTFLRRQGEDPLLVLLHDRELARMARSAGLEPAILAPGGAFDIRVVGRLGSLLRENRIDVVHAHGYRAVVNCALARRHHQFGLVRTVHGLVEASRWSTWDGFKLHLYSRLERFFGRRAGATVIYVTEDLRRFNTGHDRGLLTWTVHNGIDPLRPKDYLRPVDLAPGRFHVAAVGRITPIKGLDTAVRAVKKLDPSTDVVLNIIGTGPQEECLKSLSMELGVAGKVRFLGFKKNIYNFLTHCDALIMPSLHEGLPYTILEAMALGLPIIASRVGGVAEVLEDGESAILLGSNDVEGFARAIDRLRGDSPLCRRLTNSALGIVGTELSLETMGNKILEILRDQVV